jgi:hypothetical protein
LQPAKSKIEDPEGPAARPIFLQYARRISEPDEQTPRDRSKIKRGSTGNIREEKEESKKSSPIFPQSERT